MSEYHGIRRRAYETNGTLSRLNHVYERYRVLLTLVFIPLTVAVVRWAWTMENRMQNMESASEILVRSKCAELTAEQLYVTGLNCAAVLSRPAPQFKP